MEHLTEAQYKIIADRMIEEHRKYGDRLRTGHWADVAARKVASHMADFRKGERVFTESEVRAIMQKMNDDFEAEMRTSVQFPGRLEVDGSVVHDRIDEACDAFGIVLDPA